MTQEAFAAAFFGAIFGVGTALLIDWNRTGLRGRNAARLVFFEVAHNAKVLAQLAVWKAEVPAFATSAWEATRLDLTAVLAAEEFRDVTVLYLDLDELVEWGREGTRTHELAGPALSARTKAGRVSQILAERGWPGRPWARSRPAEVNELLAKEKKRVEQPRDLVKRPEPPGE